MWNNMVLRRLRLYSITFKQPNISSIKQYNCITFKKSDCDWGL